MKGASKWLVGGSSALLFLGLVRLFIGWIMPGGMEKNERISGGGKSTIAELKKKSDSVRQQLEDIVKSSPLPTGEALSHRVFVSRTLVFLPKDSEPVQPLVSDLVKIGRAHV